MTTPEHTFKARIQIWFNDSDRMWHYSVIVDDTRDASDAFTQWGARRAAHRLARRMARDSRRQREDYEIEVSA